MRGVLGGRRGSVGETGLPPWEGAAGMDAGRADRVRRPVSTSVSSPGRLTRGEGAGGNREVPPFVLRAGCAACLEEEGGRWGKQGSPHGRERPAWMPDAEDA